MSASILQSSARLHGGFAAPLLLAMVFAACSDDSAPTAPSTLATAPAPLFSANHGGTNICGPRCGAPILFDRFVNGGLTHYVGKMNDDGSNVTMLHLGSNPAWGPGYKQIAFNYANGGPVQQIWTMNADGSNAQQITNDPGSNDSPAFSPDGKRIVFVGYRTGKAEIYTMNANGSNEQQLTTNADNYSPSWSPGGSRILFTSLRTGTNDIFVMNADGSGKTAVVNGLDDCENPTWSPTGTKLAFVSEITFGKTYAIFTMNLDGSGLKQITPGRYMDLLPAWSRK
jgi:Tol biopolymer transport system component